MKNSFLSKVFNIFNMFIMLIILVITLYPMLYVLFASVSDPNRFMAFDGLLTRPLGFTFAAYEAVAQNPMILSGYQNTLFIVFVGVALNMVMTSLGAYALSRKKVKWNHLIMKLIIFTMFFSGGLIPFYLTVKDLGLIGSLWAVIIPSAINTFNLIIMRTAFAVIPDSMEESAKIDGASHFTILVRIMIPLTMPTIAVIILYYCVQHWNSWFNASIFIQKREMIPLQLILREILLQNDTASMTMYSDPGETQNLSTIIQYAITIVATIPILIVYPFLQRFFVKGVMIGAIKE